MQLQSRVRSTVVVLAAAGIIFSLAGLPLASAQVNVVTNKMDNNRSGLNASETLLTVSNVTSNLFGKLNAFNVDGYIEAQPLYMSGLTINGATHDVVFVETQHNSVYAIDAETSAPLWSTNFGPSVPTNAEGCNNVTGFNEVGILSTPVIDPTTNTMYLTSKTFNSTTHVATYSLHALDVTAGVEKFGGPVTISATIGTLAFSALQQLQRPGLLLVNGTLYVGFGSNGCDFNARGWLFAYSASTLQQLAVMTTQPDNSYGSSIWQSGVGPAADSAGNVYLATANGVFQYSAMDLGDSVLKISLASGSFTVQDSFTPYDQANMQTNDLDLGSSGVTLLPYQAGSTTPDLLVLSGKDADIYLINTDSMGGYNPTGNTQIPQYIPSALGGEFFGNPIYWNNNIYFMARQDYLRAYALSMNSSGNSVLTAGPQTTLKLTTYGVPVISANGNTNGIVWLVRSVNKIPLMSAYDAGGLFLLYDSSQAANNRDNLGVVGHFTNPIVANGRVFAGTQTQLVTYGLLPEINANGGSGQIANAGTTLPNPLQVMAFNPYTGTGIPGVTVNFSDGGKGGTFGNPSPVTDSTGRASTTYTLPNVAQTVSITATSSGYSVATFSETGKIGPVATLGFISGTKQVGTVGTTLPLALVVKAKDAAGNLVPGASVSFTDGNGGTFSPNPAATAGNGQASTMYTLPTVAKSLTVTASVGSITAKASEQATAGPANAINVVQGNNQTAGTNTPLPKNLTVSVVDKYKNGIPGLTVNFMDNSAGGTFSNPNPVTNNQGQATTSYTTGSQIGTVTIDATYSTLPPAVFSEQVN